MALRIAIIGAGRIAELGHLPGFAQAGAQVVALCGRSKPNLEAMAERFGVERCYDDWRTLLEDGGFDAVSVCTPPVLHREMVVASLEQGYHVLVEKPMAVSTAECDDMIAAADRTKRLLMIAHNQRFRAQHIVAKQILDSGRLGQVRRVHAVFAHGGPERWSPTGQWYFDIAAAGFGVMIDLGYHKIDLLRWLLGQEIAKIQAMTATFEKPTILDDTASALMQFEGGTLGTIQVSWAHHPDVIDSVTIDCEKGSIAVPSSFTEPVRVVEQTEAGQRIETSIICHTVNGQGWFGAAGAFVTAINDGLPSPVPGTEGKATLDAVLQAYANHHRKNEAHGQAIS
jgi:UDP-N-acetylglucosamine 3-dehydrogenase